ncbi:GNAT family N-acetyltransferase [Haloplanus halophilus]|uniref:GNAT family N-acetyltransferase n=1 Tax=Haloplanus halophilus TaxID=2949993 RepID=UPI00203FF83D|nr:GNAT family N-acetyltransferase [Haloplanus sp. GDY1]
MELTEKLNFDHEDRRDIYDYIEAHGEVRADGARRALNLDPEAFGHHVTILRRDGYIRRDGNKLRVAYQEEDVEEHDAEDLTYTIRAAQQRDLSGLIGVIRAVAEEGTYIEAETVADLLDHEEVILRHNEVRSRMVFVACVDDEVVGWVHLDLPETEKLAHTAVLTVGLLPTYRGHGIGTALLERGFRWACDHDFEKLYNSVPATNEAAIDFLEAHGWETEAVREDHYRIDDEYVDEVMMARFLDCA